MGTTSSSVVKSRRTNAERTVVQKGIEGKVLVSGATGRLGHRLVAALARCGVEVVAFVCDPNRASLNLERQAQLVCGDLRDLSSLEAAMRGVAVVYHCAAITSNSVPWTMHQDIHVLGTENVLKAALNRGGKHVIHSSSVIVYGFEPDRDGFVDENSPYPRHTDRWAHYMRSKIEAEKLVFKYWQESRLPVAVLRFGILCGMAGRSRGLAQTGSVRLMIGSGNSFLLYTYVDNAVDCSLLAAISPEAAGQVYNVVDEPQVLVRDVVAKSIAISGVQSTLVPIPPLLLLSVARLFEWRNTLAGSETPPKLSRYLIHSDCRNIRYGTTKATTQLGWRPAVTLEEGLRASTTAA